MPGDLVASHRYHFADLLSSSSTSAWPLVCCWSVAYLPLSVMPCFPRHCLTAYLPWCVSGGKKDRSKEQLIVMCLLWHEGWCYVMKCCTCQECLRVPPLWEQATAPALARSWHASAFRAQKSFIDNIWKCSLSLDSSLHLSRQKGEEFMQKIRAPASQSPFENGLRVYDSFWLREQVSKGACK